jgi:hypothetical protein
MRRWKCVFDSDLRVVPSMRRHCRFDSDLHTASMLDLSQPHIVYTETRLVPVARYCGSAKLEYHNPTYNRCTAVGETTYQLLPLF